MERYIHKLILGRIRKIKHVCERVLIICLYFILHRIYIKYRYNVDLIVTTYIYISKRYSTHMQYVK